jgi:hypothetical protein
LEDISMNTKITALTLAAATAFAFTPKPAAAHDNGLAVVGGIVGGLIIGSALSDHDAGYAHANVGYRYNDRSDDGYWKTVEVRTWVPGFWLVERGHHGRTYRRFVEGHYEFRTDRVWVAYNRYDRRDDRYYGNDDYRRDRDYRR